MSMLSAQCDELRNLAGDGSVEFVAGPIRANVLRMAADTIWELRCKLNDEQDENAKLRELVHCMAYCMQYERDCDECRMNGADGNIAEPCGCDGLLDRLHELGIEVDA